VKKKAIGIIQNEYRRMKVIGEGKNSKEWT